MPPLVCRTAQLKRGITDRPYLAAFRRVVQACVERYSPTAIVMQCGANCLSGDRVGALNLSVDGTSSQTPSASRYRRRALLNATGQSRVTLSLRQEHLKSSLCATPGAKGA